MPFNPMARETAVKRDGNLSAPGTLGILMRRLEGGRLRPGARIIPRDIALELGGSTIPVREALCQLVGRDIIVEKRNKGFCVAPMTSSTVRSLYSAHGMVIDMAIRCITTQAMPTRRSRSRWRIFAAITQASQNEALIGIQRYLAGRLAVVRRHEGDFLKGAGLERDILDAQRLNDLAATVAAIRRFHELCEKGAADIWQRLSDR